MRSNRTRRLLTVFALVCVSIALFTTIWTVLPAPNYTLWLFSIGATELSLYFGLLGIVGAALGVIAWRRGGRWGGMVAVIGVLARWFFPF